MNSEMMGFDQFPRIARTETARAIYLIDVDTCEIVYMNNYAKEMLQMAYDDESYCGKSVTNFCRDRTGSAGFAATAS